MAAGFDRNSHQTSPPPSISRLGSLNSQLGLLDAAEKTCSDARLQAWAPGTVRITGVPVKGLLSCWLCIIGGQVLDLGQ